VDNTTNGSQEEIGKLFYPIRAMNKFSCLILPIIQAYNVGISRLRSEDAILVVRLTPVERHDSDRMPNSDRRMPLLSYARLRLEDMTLVVYPDSR
jgi:hypothetical protein